jgi:hypothetical protein
VVSLLEEFELEVWEDTAKPGCDRPVLVGLAQPAKREVNRAHSVESWVAGVGSRRCSSTLTGLAELVLAIRTSERAQGGRTSSERGVFASTFGSSASRPPA